MASLKKLPIELCKDVLFLALIMAPSLYFIIPWLLDGRPSFGFDFYGGGALIMNKSFDDVMLGYFPEWYFGACFQLFPAIYWYWLLSGISSIFSTNYFIVMKMTFFITYLVSVFSSYFISKELFRERFYAICSSLIYVYAPYRFAWLGTEAIWSLSFYYALNPLAFYMLLQLLNKIVEDSTLTCIFRNATISAITLALIILTHPQAFVILAAPFYLLFALIYIFIHVFLFRRQSFTLTYMYKKVFCFAKHFTYSIIPFILALIFTMFWWLPALLESDFLYKPPINLNVIASKTPSILSIYLIQGRSYTIPRWTYFFCDSVEILLAVSLGIFIWISYIYSVKAGLRQRNLSWAAALAISTIPYISLCMGSYSPLSHLIYTYKSLLSQIRAPDRWLSVVILSLSMIFPIGISEFSKSLRKYIGRHASLINHVASGSKTRIILIAFLIILIYANSTREMSYAFISFDLDDVTLGYKFLKDKPNDSRIMAVPLFETYKYVESSIDEKLPLVINPQFYFLEYGGKENIAGGSASLSVKELSEFLQFLRSWSSTFSVNLSTIADVYSINYVWVDKRYNDTSRFFLDSSLVKVFESENYVIYENLDAYPRIFMLSERSIPLLGNWSLAEGNGALIIREVTDNGVLLKINYCNKTEREWRYITYWKKFDGIGLLDEIYGEYKILGADPSSIQLRLKLVTADGYSFIYIIHPYTNEGFFRVPVFWFQPASKDGRAFNSSLVRWLKIGVEEEYDETGIPKQGIIKINNITIYRHEVKFVDYKKVGKLTWMSTLKDLKDQPVMIVLAYAYNPNFKLRLFEEEHASTKVLGFLNGFWINQTGFLEITIKYEPQKWLYIGSIISVTTLIVCITYLIFDWAKEKPNRTNKKLRTKSPSTKKPKTMMVG